MHSGYRWRFTDGIQSAGGKSTIPSVLQRVLMNHRRIGLQTVTKINCISRSGTFEPNVTCTSAQQFKFTHPWLWLSLRRVAPELDLASQLHGLRVRRHLELLAQVWKENGVVASLVRAIDSS